MPLSKQAIVDQIDSVLEACKSLLAGSQYSDFSDEPENASQAANLLFSAIQRLGPPGSSYINSAKAQESWLKGTVGRAIPPLLGALKALRTDYAAGYLQSVTELIHADIFADFLDMADYLLNQDYKDPAAVMVGSVLEEHLRKLCQKYGLPTDQNQKPKKADALNSDLVASNAYSRLDQKSVTAWLDLRNKAAHGKYGEYSKEQVKLMLQGVQDFISRHPA